jgi:hypothetical protein
MNNSKQAVTAVGKNNSMPVERGYFRFKIPPALSFSFNEYIQVNKLLMQYIKS